MIGRQEHQHRAALTLLTGHFHETSGYKAQRPGGVSDWLLIRTADGKGRFGHDAGDLVAQAGDWVLLRPGTPHDYGVEATRGYGELVWVHFQPRPEWQPLLGWPSMNKGLMRLRLPGAAGRKAGRRLLDVHRFNSSTMRNGELLAMNALEELLLLCDLHNPSVRDAPMEPRIARAIEYIEANYVRPMTLERMAAVSGLSLSRFAHLFRQVTSQTPQRYLETRRMRHAADLLRRTSFSVKQIAGIVGFEDPLYFSQRFKVSTGQSPRAFRTNDASIPGHSPPPNLPVDASSDY